jgi:hypothetical protein
MTLPAVLMLNHHPYTLLDGDRRTVPVDEVELHLVTHTFGGVDGFDPKLFPRVSVLNIYDERRVEEICRWTIREYGIQRVVAVHELEMLRAARLRSEFGLPGMTPQTTVLFRDKVAMKEAVSAAGAARVPRFAVLEQPSDLDGLSWSGRTVVKDRYGLGASDVHVIDDLPAAGALVRDLPREPGRWQVEEFVTGDMYHCDAVVRGHRVLLSSVSRYLSTPGDYAPGGMLGSLLLDEHDHLRHRIVRLNERVLSALRLQDGVTHLEVFHTPEDDLVFCEVAARPGGGAIDRVIRHAYGVDIFEAAVRLQCGLPMEVPAGGRRGGAYGFVGFYPGGGVLPEIPRGLSAVGVVDHVHHAPADAGGVRHAADFQDVYTIRAADHAELLERAEAIRSVYRGLSPLPVRPTRGAGPAPSHPSRPDASRTSL